MSQELGKQLAREASQQQLQRAHMGLASKTGPITRRIFLVLPRSLRWMIPVVQQQLRPRISQVSDLVSQKTKQLLKRPNLPNSQSPPEPTPQPLSPIPTTRQQVDPIPPQYDAYPCSQGNPLYCTIAQHTIADNPKAQHCRHCRFPTPLPPETIIQGDRDRYQIQTFLGQRGRGRLYQAIQLSDRQPVIIKAYPLPERTFNLAERRQRQERFKHLGNIHLADGRIQDQRLIIPKDTIASPQDPRYYLVTPGHLNSLPSLNHHRQQHGPLSDRQIQTLLNQVLQSLELLHGQKFQLQSGTLKQGILHNNLSLNSLLFAPHDQGFFIYLCDLGLWEHPSHPHLPDLNPASPQQDLTDLGTLAFELLSQPSSQPNPDPKIEDHWPTNIHPPLKQHILSLIGLSSHPFTTAQQARHHLLATPPPPWPKQQHSQPLNLSLTEPDPLTPNRKPTRPWIKVLSLSLILAGGVLLALMIHRFLLRQSSPAQAQEPICCIDQIGDLPQGQFTYSFPRNGTWHTILQQPNLISQNLFPAADSETPPPFSLSHHPTTSSASAIAQVLAQERDFAIVPLPQARHSHRQALHRQLGYRDIAQDGIVVFVAFSYSRRDKSLPQHLNGQLTLEQVRQLYRGQIDNWQELGGPDLPVQLYVPDRPELRQYFEQEILQTPQAIADFRNQQIPDSPTDSPDNSFLETSPTVQAHSSQDMLRTIIRDFEQRNLGSIGFAPLSQVFGQCSVYPLALAKDDDQPAIAPLIHHRDSSPISPQTDLCNTKGSYGPNIPAFSSDRYPLAYRLAVIYPRDNRLAPAGQKFAELLTTQDIQTQLRRAGLIPIHPDSPP